MSEQAVMAQPIVLATQAAPVGEASSTPMSGSPQRNETTNHDAVQQQPQPHLKTVAQKQTVVEAPAMPTQGPTPKPPVLVAIPVPVARQEVRLASPATPIARAQVSTPQAPPPARPPAVVAVKPTEREIDRVVVTAPINQQMALNIDSVGRGNSLVIQLPRAKRK